MGLNFPEESSRREDTGQTAAAWPVQGCVANTVCIMHRHRPAPQAYAQKIIRAGSEVDITGHVKSEKGATVDEAVREGKCQYERAFGKSSKELFEAIYRSEEDMTNFIHFMDSTWNICGKDIVEAFDLSEFHTVYDLGGCTGSLAKQLVSTYKESTVTIMDLPKVVQTAKKHFVTDKEQQIHFLEGDFFNDPIPEADLFIVARIIHDWTEEKCIKLLTKVYQSCRPGGGVLIVELLLNEDKSGPVISQLFSLHMLVHTEGKERTPSEYTKLLTDTGFRDIKVKVFGKMYGAILGRK